jgi:hypothetical protein
MRGKLSICIYIFKKRSKGSINEIVAVGIILDIHVSIGCKGFVLGHEKTRAER